MKKFVLRPIPKKIVMEELPCYKCGEKTSGRDTTIDGDGIITYRPLCSKCRAIRYRTGSKFGP